MYMVQHFIYLLMFGVFFTPVGACVTAGQCSTGGPYIYTY